jgi:hypothetical protein
MRPPHVRFGSEADIGAFLNDVRFTPESGHRKPACGHSNSGSLAILAAIRRALSLVTGMASDPIGLSCPLLLLSPKDVHTLGQNQNCFPLDCVL